jgi:hypothetical protein
MIADGQTDKGPPREAAAAGPALLGQRPKQTWAWLPVQMPGVARLVAERRAQHGDAWVDECWRRGVLLGEPGWFFAGEGALMVGTLWDDEVLVRFAQARVTRDQALLIMRSPEAQFPPARDAFPLVATLPEGGQHGAH